MKVHLSRANTGKHIFVLTFGANVAPDLLANWLHQKIKNRATKLFLDRKEVQIEKTEIEIFISEKIADNNSGSS